MRIHPSAYLAAGVLLLAGPSFAQDFAGARIEARAGYDRVSIDDDFEDIPGRLDGAALGVAAGYDRAFAGDYRIGVELGLTLPIDSTQSVALGSDRLTAEAGADVDALVRIGRVINPKTLAFAKAGYARSRFEAEYSSAAGPAETERTHQDLGGLRLGLGMERALTSGLSATVEYRFTAYEDDVRRDQLLTGLTWRL